jgi:hypothetical protein
MCVVNVLPSSALVSPVHSALKLKQVFGHTLPYSLCVCVCVCVCVIFSKKKNRASGGYSHSDFKRNHGSEPQQNLVLVFSITHTQKRMRPPVWIILVLHAELAK